MPETLLPEIVAVAGVVPNCVHVPPAGLGDKVALVVNVFVAGLGRSDGWCWSGLGVGGSVTTCGGVALRRAAFWATVV